MVNSRKAVAGICLCAALVPTYFAVKSGYALNLLHKREKLLNNIYYDKRAPINMSNTSTRRNLERKIRVYGLGAVVLAGLGAITVGFERREEQ
jgi:hypothetical protein